MNSPLYKTESAKTELLAIYDRKHNSLTIPTEDIYVNTFAGKTHIIASGNVKNPPVVILHAFNAGAPVGLEVLQDLYKDYRLYAIDTVGQVTKSAETRLSVKTDDYGKWVSEVFTELNLEKADVIGVSYGGFILQKLIQVAPYKINKAIMLVPAGIASGNLWKLTKRVSFPLFKFFITKSEQDLLKFMDAFYPEDEKTDEHILLQKTTLMGTKLDFSTPPLLKKEDVQSFNAPVYVMVADNDIFFPGPEVLEACNKLFNNMKGTHILKSSKHMPNKSAHEEIKNKMAEWLEE